MTTTLPTAVAVDIGGTFTDAMAVDRDGRIAAVAKVLTNPGQPAAGFLDALTAVAQGCGCQLSEMLGGLKILVHGTTLPTNALLTRSLAKVGMLTTSGFRDQIETRRGQKNVNRSMFDVFVDPPRPLVPRRLRRPVSERRGPRGEIWIPLSEEGIAQETERLVSEGVEAVAICFLHSYRFPDHELAAAPVVRRVAGDSVYISMSHAVAPIEGEYERFSTTVVNAGLGPIVDGYLQRLQVDLERLGFTGLLAILRSDSLIQTIDESRQRPVDLVASGPAGAAAGAARFSEVTEPNLVSLEVGGTSSDVAFVIGGDVAQKSGLWVSEEYVAIKSLDVVSIGAGGGSIAQVNSLGLLQVGPRSAGASPGPACYGMGGTEPTVTDANLVLGYLDVEQTMGGIRLDREAAVIALTPVAEGLGMDVVDTASAVFRTVGSHMADRIAELATERGIDLRRGFALLAGGGAGPMHACSVAEEIGVGTIFIPPTPGLLSAFGMLGGELGIQIRSVGPGVIDDLDSAELRRNYEGLVEQANDRMPPGTRADELMFGADFRYDGQYHDLELWFATDLEAIPSGTEIREVFDKAHEELHGFSVPQRGVRLLTALVKAKKRLAKLHHEVVPLNMAPTRRSIYIDGTWVQAAVVGSNVTSAVPGPAVIHCVDTTILVHPGWTAHPLERGGFKLERGRTER